MDRELHILQSMLQQQRQVQDAPSMHGAYNLPSVPSSGVDEEIRNSIRTLRRYIGSEKSVLLDSDAIAAQDFPSPRSRPASVNSVWTEDSLLGTWLQQPYVPPVAAAELTRTYDHRVPQINNLKYPLVHAQPLHDVTWSEPASAQNGISQLSRQASTLAGMDNDAQVDTLPRPVAQVESPGTLSEVHSCFSPSPGVSGYNSRQPLMAVSPVAPCRDGHHLNWCPDSDGVETSGRAQTFVTNGKRAGVGSPQSRPTVAIFPGSGPTAPTGLRTTPDSQPSSSFIDADTQNLPAGHAERPPDHVSAMLRVGGSGTTPVPLSTSLAPTMGVCDANATSSGDQPSLKHQMLAGLPELELISLDESSDLMPSPFRVLGQAGTSFSNLSPARPSLRSTNSSRRRGVVSDTSVPGDCSLSSSSRPGPGVSSHSRLASPRPHTPERSPCSDTTTRSYTSSPLRGLAPGQPDVQRGSQASQAEGPQPSPKLPVPPSRAEGSLHQNRRLRGCLRALQQHHHRHSHATELLVASLRRRRARQLLHACLGSWAALAKARDLESDEEQAEGQERSGTTVRDTPGSSVWSESKSREASVGQTLPSPSPQPGESPANQQGQPGVCDVAPVATWAAAAEEVALLPTTPTGPELASAAGLPVREALPAAEQAGDGAAGSGRQGLHTASPGASSEEGPQSPGLDDAFLTLAQVKEWALEAGQQAARRCAEALRPIVARERTLAAQAATAEMAATLEQLRAENLALLNRRAPTQDAGTCCSEDGITVSIRDPSAVCEACQCPQTSRAPAHAQDEEAMEAVHVRHSMASDSGPQSPPAKSASGARWPDEGRECNGVGSAAGEGGGEGGGVVRLSLAELAEGCEGLERHLLETVAVVEGLLRSAAEEAQAREEEALAAERAAVAQHLKLELDAERREQARFQLSTLGRLEVELALQRAALEAGLERERAATAAERAERERERATWQEAMGHLRNWLAQFSGSVPPDTHLVRPLGGEGEEEWASRGAGSTEVVTAVRQLVGWLTDKDSCDADFSHCSLPSIQQQALLAGPTSAKELDGIGQVAGGRGAQEGLEEEWRCSRQNQDQTRSHELLMPAADSGLHLATAGCGSPPQEPDLSPLPNRLVEQGRWDLGAANGKWGELSEWEAEQKGGVRGGAWAALVDEILSAREVALAADRAAQRIWEMDAEIRSVRAERDRLQAQLQALLGKGGRDTVEMTQLQVPHAEGLSRARAEWEVGAAIAVRRAWEAYGARILAELRALARQHQHAHARVQALMAERSTRAMPSGQAAASRA